jgi:hypothetical protein
MEDNLQWKTTSNRRQPSMEDNLQWKTTFNGRQPPLEDDLQWKTTSNGRQLPMEETSYGRRPPMKDDLQWKTSSMEDSIVFNLNIPQNHVSSFIGEIQRKYLRKSRVWLCSAQLVLDVLLALLSFYLQCR